MPEIKDMTLAEIAERRAAINSELEEENADLDKLEEEVRALNEREEQLKEETEKREKIAHEVRNGAGEIIDTFVEERTNMPVEKFTIDSAEYRVAWLKNLRNMELTDVEQRAFTDASGSAGPAIPTQTANEILVKVKQYAPLLEKIRLLNVAGHVKFAIEDSVADAAIHTQNSTINPTTDTLREIELGGYEIAKLVQVSRTVETMAIDAFEGWLTDMIAERLAALITNYLINGTGSSQPEGITNVTFGTTNSVTVGSTASLKAGDVQELIGMLPGGYDAEACFLMSKKTLIGDFAPLQDNSKNNIVTNVGREWFVYGYPVVLDERITQHEAFLANFREALVGNLSGQIEVVKSFDINTNSMKYLGTSLFDSKIAHSEAVVKLTKATA